MGKTHGFLIATLVLIYGFSVAAGEAWLRLGEPLQDLDATPIQAILDDPDSFHDRHLRIEGRIASVCTHEGCFVEVVPTDGGGEGIVVNFPGLAHTFPLDCAGRGIVIEGRFYQKVFPHARVDHWQHHSFRPGVAVPDYSLALRMDVLGAEIGGSRTAPPAPAKIRTASPEKTDLEMMGFETGGFGIDRRRIAPGEVIPRPSTGGNRWMVIGRTGRVVVRARDREPVIVRAGEMSFLPAGVVFEIHNPADSEASFDLIYSQKIAP